MLNRYVCDWLACSLAYRVGDQQTSLFVYPIVFSHTNIYRVNSGSEKKPIKGIHRAAMPVIIVIWHSELKVYNEELICVPFLIFYSIIYIRNSKENEN